MSLLSPLTSFELSAQAFFTATSRPTDGAWPRLPLQPLAIDDLSSFVDRLGSIITQLAAVHHLHKRYHGLLHNALYSHTRSLPLEILGRVFELIMIDRTENPPPIARMKCVTHVCSSWRQLAIGWKPLWCHLDFWQLPRNLLNQWIQRSSPLPISVLDSGSKNTDMLEEIIPRIRSLNFNNDTLNLFNPSRCAFEKLECLTLDANRSHNLYNWAMPALRKLRITGEFTIIPMLHSVLFNLQSVMIDGDYLLHELRTFLSSLDNLDCLRISGETVTFNMDGCRSTLKSLRHLRIEYTTSMEFLVSWACPNLETLWCNEQFDWEDERLTSLEKWPEWAWTTGFLEHTPSLTSLTFSLRGSDIHWIPLFHHLATNLQDPTQPTILSNLKTLNLLGSTQATDATQQAVLAFLKALYGQRSKQLFSHSPGRDTPKVLDRLRIRQKDLFKERREEIEALVVSLEILSDIELDEMVAVWY